MSEGYWEEGVDSTICISTIHFSGYFCTSCDTSGHLPSICAMVFGSHVQITPTRREVRVFLYIWDRKLTIKDYLEVNIQLNLFCYWEKYTFGILEIELLDRSLMIGWRKNSSNPERMSSVFTLVSVCLSVCNQTTEHIFWPRNLIFGLSDPCDMSKKQIFLFFRNFHLYTFIGIFHFFSLYNTSKFFSF